MGGLPITMSVTFCMMIAFRKKNTLPAYRSKGGGDHIIRAIDSLKRKVFQINEQLVSHLSPLGWQHINLSGDYVWRNNLKLGLENSGHYAQLIPIRTKNSIDHLDSLF